MTFQDPDIFYWYIREHFPHTIYTFGQSGMEGMKWCRDHLGPEARSQDNKGTHLDFNARWVMHNHFEFHFKSQDDALLFKIAMSK